MRDDVQLVDRPSARLKNQRPRGRPPFECIALLPQGGGALGSYQAGVYEALAEADARRTPDLCRRAI
jgi:NTE family protein